MYGKQSPLLVCLVALVPVEVPQPMMQDIPACELAVHDWDFVFEEDWSRFAWSDDGTWGADLPCSVLPGVSYSLGRRVVGDGG